MNRIMTMKRAWMPIAALLLTAVVGCKDDSAAKSGMHPAVGQKLMQVDLIPLTGDGTPILSADLRGKVVLLNFWATFCPPCKEELPDIALLHEHYSGNDRVLILAVSLGQGSLESQAEETKTLLRSLKLTLPTYADPASATWSSYLALDMQQAIPTTLILDQQGVIRAAWTGVAAKSQLQDAIEKLLASPETSGETSEQAGTDGKRMDEKKK